MATLQTNDEHIKRLKTFAASDANHDFGAVFTKVYSAYKDIGTPIPAFAAPYVSDPWKLLSDFMISALDIKSIDLNTPRNITSKTGHEYTLCSFNATDLENSMRFLYGAEGLKNEILSSLYLFSKEISLVEPKDIKEYLELLLKVHKSVYDGKNITKRRKYYYSSSETSQRT